ncbi:MAG: tetratricopeptide repeat protein, partial [Waterburya sp.]
MYQPLECRPDSYQEWYQQGNQLRAEGYYQEALISYDRALDYHPRDYWTWYRKGAVLEALGYYYDAIDSYAKAIAIQPDNYWAWYEQGCIYAVELNQYQQAIACFTQAS